MKKAILALGFVLAFTACDKIMPAKKETASVNTELKESERVTANLDVDIAATETFRSELLKSYPLGTPSETIEKDLSSKKYDCGPDPIKLDERACTNTETKDKCMIMSIVRTNPYTPDGAQIIKACKA